MKQENEEFSFEDMTEEQLNYINNLLLNNIKESEIRQETYKNYLKVLELEQEEQKNRSERLKNQSERLKNQSERLKLEIKILEQEIKRYKND